jgi:hypothetical protein
LTLENLEGLPLGAKPTKRNSIGETRGEGWMSETDNAEALGVLGAKDNAR